MLVQLYSFNALPSEIRGTFHLVDDPLSDDPLEKARALAYLRSLSIFYYRDEDDINGILIPTQANGNPAETQEMFHFDAFKSLVNLDPETLQVMSWPDNRSADAQRRITRNGDNFSWMIWNLPRRIKRVNEASVETS